MVNNHGDRFRPLRIGLDWTPYKWPNFMAYKWGAHPNYLLIGMILQVDDQQQWGILLEIRRILWPEKNPINLLSDQ